jgi:hypothetical protein
MHRKDKAGPVRYIGNTGSDLCPFGSDLGALNGRFLFARAAPEVGFYLRFSLVTPFNNGRFDMYSDRNMDHHWCTLAASGALAFVASIVVSPLWL